MKITRFEFEKVNGGSNIGIIAGSRYFLDLDEALVLIQDFEEDLAVPPMEFDRNGCYCFFTEEGVKKFKVAIDSIIKAAEKKNIKTKALIMNDINLEDEWIVYHDEYQVVLDAYVFRKAQRLDENRRTQASSK